MMDYMSSSDDYPTKTLIMRMAQTPQEMQRAKMNVHSTAVDLETVRRHMRGDFSPEAVQDFISQMAGVLITVEHGMGINGYPIGPVGINLSASLSADGSVIHTQFQLYPLDQLDVEAARQQQRVIDDILNGSLGYMSINMGYRATQQNGPDNRPIALPYGANVRVRNISLTADPDSNVGRHAVVNYSKAANMSTPATAPPTNAAAPAPNATPAQAPPPTEAAPKQAAPTPAQNAAPPATPASAPPTNVGSAPPAADGSAPPSTTTETTAAPPAEMTIEIPEPAFTTSPDGTITMSEQHLKLTPDEMNALVKLSGLPQESVAKMSPIEANDLYVQLTAFNGKAFEAQENLKRVREESDAQAVKYAKLEADLAALKAEKDRYAAAFEPLKTFVGKAYPGDTNAVADPLSVAKVMLQREIDYKKGNEQFQLSLASRQAAAIGMVQKHAGAQALAPQTPASVPPSSSQVPQVPPSANQAMQQQQQTPATTGAAAYNPNPRSDFREAVVAYSKNARTTHDHAVATTLNSWFDQEEFRKRQELVASAKHMQNLFPSAIRRA